jgi:hypothetical protein
MSKFSAVFSSAALVKLTESVITVVLQELPVGAKLGYGSGISRLPHESDTRHLKKRKTLTVNKTEG